MPKWIDHIVVRVKDLDEGLRDYESKLGLKASKGPDAIPDLGMTRAILPIGDEGRFIELCEPLGEGAIGQLLVLDQAVAPAMVGGACREKLDDLDGLGSDVDPEDPFLVHSLLGPGG